MRPGDLIVSRDEHDAEAPVSVSQVVRTITGTSSFVTLTVGGRAIRTTASHLFWVQGRGWVKTQHLAEGDFLVGHDGRLAMVNGLEFSAELISVYNLEVAGYHTYFVGDPAWNFSIWTHNEGCPTAAELQAARIKSEPGEIRPPHPRNLKCKMVDASGV